MPKNIDYSNAALKVYVSMELSLGVQKLNYR